MGLLAGFVWYRCYYPHWSRDALSFVCEIFTHSAPWAELVLESPCPFVCFSVCLRHRVQYFQGLSLAPRSHDQIPASHWLTPPPPWGGGGRAKKKSLNLCICPTNSSTIRIGRESWCFPYAGFSLYILYILLK